MRDPREGNLERRLTVCGQPWAAQETGGGTWGSSSAPLVPVLLACNISTKVPGDYNITYSVTNSAGLTSETWRTLTVMGICPAGERLCADLVRW